MHKEDFALNNLQGLICHKTQPTNYSLNQYFTNFSGSRHILKTTKIFCCNLNVNLKMHDLHFLQVFFSRPLGFISRTQTTIAITLIIMFNSFFQLSGKIEIFVYFFFNCYHSHHYVQQFFSAVWQDRDICLFFFHFPLFSRSGLLEW